MKTASKQFKTKLYILILGFIFVTGSVMALENIIPPNMREIAIQQGKNALKSGGEADLSMFLNASLMKQPLMLKSKKFKGITGSIRAVVGGRNFTAADVDYAQVPFSTSNGIGLSNLFHDGGEWPGTNGNPAADDGISSYGNDWAGEIYDADGNGHDPKAVLRYIGTHCYIFLPVMYFPTLPRGISPTEAPTPPAKAEWGMYWPDSVNFANGPYYYAPNASGTVLEPRYILGSDKNLARMKLKELADEFDSVIYPKVREYFGSEPDVDGDPKIYILLDDIRDGSGSFRGYFWAGNELPRTTQALSNEKELLNIDLFPSFAMDAKDTYGTIAHEFTHMIIYNEGYHIVNGQLIGMKRWLEEGMTQFSQFLYNGKFSTNLDEFIKNPDVMLTDDRIEKTWLGPSPFANYGASFLWVYYLAEKYGKANLPNFLKSIVRSSKYGMEAIDEVLKPFGTNSAQVFSDWVIANYLDKTRRRDASLLNSGKWGYNVDNDFDTSNDIGVNQRLPVHFSEKVLLTTNTMARSSNVNPWAADYIEISGNTGNLNLGFDGDDRGQFKVGVIKRGPNVDPDVEFFYLNDKQAGNLIIQNYGTGNSYENLVMVPMVTSNANYEKLNYVYSGTFDDLKLAVFPNPVFENKLHIVVATNDKFTAQPRLQMTYNGQQGYLTMVPVNDSTYIANYDLTQSGEGVIEANGTNQNGVILSNTIKFSAVYYPPGSQGLLKASFVTVDIPKGSMRSGGTVIVASPGNPSSYEGVSRLSPDFNIGIPVEHTDKPIKISMPTSIASDKSKEKAGLYKIDGKTVKWLGRVNWNGKEATGEVETSCGVFVGLDNQKPKISTKCESLKNGWVAVNANDLGSGINPKMVQVKYGNKFLPCVYDAKNKQLRFNASSLQNGTYNFDVKVTDNAGNTNSASIRAGTSGVNAISQVITYPNPARTYSNIRAAFTGSLAKTANAVVKIYDTSGDKVITLPLNNNGSGICEARWNLKNSDDTTVANGVYFAEVKARLGSRSYKERRKIAVLR